MDYPVLISALALVGVLAGLLAGLLGVGGGIVLVPALFFIFDLLGYPSAYTMHAAVGTSLAVIVPTGLVSTIAHRQRDAVRMDLAVKIGVGAVAGAVAGTLIADSMSGSSLRALFAVALMLLAAVMLLNPSRFPFFKNVPGQPWAALAGAGIGTLSTLMGIGGASISVPFMSLCRVPIRQAVGTAAALGPVIAAPAMIGFVLIGLGEDGLPPWSIGYINMPALAVIVLASVMAAPWGARLAHRLPVDILRRVFAGFMAVVALKMLVGVIYES